jgi:hypothetical protein
MRHPSLQTGRADFPHPAFQSVGSLSRGSGFSPRPQAGRSDFRWLPDQFRLAVSAAASPCGHSLRFSVRCSIRPASTFLRSLRSTVVTRFFPTTDALTPSGRFFGPPGHDLRCSSRVSLIVSGILPTIPSPTICVLTGTVPAASGFSRHYRLRHYNAGSPTHADRIEFTVVAHSDNLRYGLVVLVPLLSTPHCCDAVTVRYRTDFSPRRSGLPPLRIPAFTGARYGTVSVPGQMRP